eukprot:TRINITY_DN17213_c0_g1_i2.p1 TRINITY_DN17213_c0_g1~~TRINITY_DN17213_c0_g1_i2.p1  ORF type:complete len:193 (-),score=33.49 TRINITY_DN17213_c0_g1_i2:49-564(-)
MRLGFVSYKDFCDGRLRIQAHNFDEPAKIRNMISTLSASGGGDTPEDMCGGLEHALSFSWRGDAKFIVLVADCPCHGSEFHSFDDSHPNQYDLYPQQHPRVLLQTIRAKGIELFFTKITQYTDQMLERFKHYYAPSQLRILNMTDANAHERFHVDLTNELVARIINSDEYL